MQKRIVKIGKYKCLGPTITESKIKSLQKILAKGKSPQRLRTFCKILSGKTRFQILWLLNREKELCVCDLTDILKTTVSAISHQLRVLSQANLVKNRRDGQTIYYSLVPSKLTQFFKNYIRGGRRI